MSSRRGSVFRRPKTWDNYKNLLDEVQIWAQYKDPLPLDIACRVYEMMTRKAYPPYTGLEIQFFRYFEEMCTPLLVERFLDDLA